MAAIISRSKLQAQDLKLQIIRNYGSNPDNSVAGSQVKMQKNAVIFATLTKFKLVSRAQRALQWSMRSFGV